MESAARKANVMFVDDEQRVLTSMRALFRRDYNVHLANSGDEALALLDSEDMDVIVSDQRMPGMTGVDVLKACKQRAPRAMRILLTGYADKDAIAASINEGEVFRYLTKPCARETLRDTVAMAVSAAGLGAPEVDHTAAANDAPPMVPHEASEPPAIDAPAAEPAFRPTVSTSVQLRPGRPAAATLRRDGIELMVLSADRAFTAALESALGMSYRLHAVADTEQALSVLEDNPIGVVITDMAVNADEIHALTNDLKHCVPELVTIVASDHSDAHRLIDLINGGQVFRFLLKPIKPKQTAIWIDSAVGKHLDLVNNPRLVARHAVSRPSTGRLFSFGDRLIRSLASRFLRSRQSTGAAHGDDRP